MHYRVCNIIFQLATGATLASGQPASSQATPTTSSPEVASTPSVLDRYQTCFDRFVDLENADQNFMRQCLGLVPQTRADGRHEFLTHRELKAGDEKRTDDVTNCYAKALAVTKSLNVFPQGTIDILVRIDGDGVLKQFKVGKKSIQDSTVLGCLDEARKNWVFPKNTSTSTIPIRYQWELTVQKNRRPNVSLSEGFPKVRKPPGLTPSEIVPVVQANQNAVRLCYESLLKTNPNAKGEVIVEMLVGKQGQVRKTKIVRSEIVETTLQQCILEQLGRLRFPKPRGGKPFAVRYPFLLDTTP